MDDDRTPGWLLARLELAIAVVAVLIIPIWFVTQPDALVPVSVSARSEPWVNVLPLAAEIAMLLGLAWMIRIWRGPTREVPPAWRYRDGD